MSRVKGFTKKLFAGGMTVMMVVSLWAPVVRANSVEQFIEVANANHWGRSDLRAYLNDGLGTVATDGTVTNKYYWLNSVANSDNKCGYASHFTDKEYALIRPWTYSTNVFSSEEIVDSTYTTTDKFVLPSANYSNNTVLSWGNDDISANATYTEATTNDRARMIPISYWTSSMYPAWTRSSAAGYSIYSLEGYRGSYTISSSVSVDGAVAPVFKLDLSSVNFASSISAKRLVESGGCQKMEISGATIFGQKSTDPLPDYGMYLKTGSNADFEARAMTYNADTSTITVDFRGGVAGQYVVGQIYKQDDLKNGTTCYGFAQEIPSNDTTKISVDVSRWNLTSLDGYTIKIWMEDATTTNLPSATTPITFTGAGGVIEWMGTECENLRLFAMKNQLQTSWGDLASLDSDAYDEVLKGTATTLVGNDPTNQKIYYGTDNSGKPLEFWIAGRETSTGEISAEGDIICLYAAKAVDTHSFNASTDSYLKTPSVNDFAFTEPRNLIYDGSPKEATVSPVEEGVGDVTVKYYDAYGKPLDSAPVTPGSYRVKIDVARGENYEALSNCSGEDWAFMIEPKAIVVDSVTVSDKYYDGTTNATVEEVSFNNLVGKEKLNFNTDFEVNATFDSKSSGTEKTVTITVTLKDTNKANCYTFMEDGKMTDTISVNATADILEHTDWGTLVEDKGIIQYVDTDGITSVEVTDNNVIWLCETTDGRSIWYGLDNSNNIFEVGSRFYVKEITASDASYTEIVGSVDEGNVQIIQDDNGKVFLFGVQNADGTDSNSFESAKLYVQTDEKWKGDAKAVLIANGVDEALLSSNQSIQMPEGEASVVALDVNHGGFVTVCDAYCNGTNHTLEDTPVFTWTEDFSSCKITLTCGNNTKHVETYDCSVTSEIKKAATCKDMGTITYIATYEKYEDRKDASIEKTENHVWDGGTVTQEATALADGSKQFVCTVCGEMKSEPIVATGIPAKGKVIEDATTNSTYKVTKSGATGGTVQYVTPKNKKQASVTIPATITVDGITYKVTSIAKDAFKGNKYVTTIKMGKNITTIGANAFYNCKKLKSVTIGSKVTTIGDKAFYKCIALTKITIPSKVKKIGKSAFYGCKKLKTITIKTSKLTTKNVGKNAFKGVGSKYYKKVVVKVPKKKVQLYKTVLKKRGLSSKAKVQRY